MGTHNHPAYERHGGNRLLYTAPSWEECVAEEKRRNRLALAALPPQEAQRLVSTGIPTGQTRIAVRGVPERPALGLAGLTSVDE